MVSDRGIGPDETNPGLVSAAIQAITQHIRVEGLGPGDLLPSEADMSIARNLFIGREPTLFSVCGVGILDQKKMGSESIKAIANVDLHLRSPDALVGELSGGQRQGVAIARAMHFKSKVLVLDEPTNHLSVKETSKVIGFVRGLKAQGVTGVFISHNMHHVFDCCDRVVAMARGEVVLDKRIEETSIDEVHNVL